MFRLLPKRPEGRLRLAATGPLRSILTFLVLGWTLGLPTPVTAQWFDGMDQLPLKWQLAENDCQARTGEHQIDADGGHDHGPCEAFTVAAGHGTRLLLEYRIPPSRVVDELAAQLWLRSAQPGARIGFRVRYPYVHDKQTGRTVSSLVFGDRYRKAGQWERLRLTDVPQRMREKEAALRVEFDSDVDLRGAFVDAIIVDVYNQPGVMTVRLDDVSIDHLVPVGSVSVAARPSLRKEPEPSVEPSLTHLERPAFAPQRVTRIIEHNGEPLAYLRSLGFDAVLLSTPPEATILREANQARMLIYAPPPTAPNPDWEALLEPIAGWYLGTSRAHSHLPDVQREVQRVSRFPARWQRALFVAPAEGWDQFASIVPALVYDLPPTTLGIVPAEEYDYIRDARARTRRPVQVAMGVQTSPPATLIEQLDANANHIGATQVEDYGWHPMWLQSMRALAQCPQAIVFRSTQSLASGLPADQKRAMAVGFVNRCIEAVSPLVARATPAGTFECSGADYTARRMSLGGTEVIMATTEAAGPVNVLSGDGAVLTIQLPPTLTKRFAWRLTGMTAERLELESTPHGPVLQIVSPDAAEMLLISDDTTIGFRVSNLLARLAMPTALDRWQLTTESVFQTRVDWDSLVASRLAPASSRPASLMAGAANTLTEGNPSYLAGDGPATLRLARRADAWMLRSRAAMTEALLPRPDVRYQFPAMLAPGGVQLQVALSSQLQSGRWSRNLLPAGVFDSTAALAESGWKHDQRIEATTRSVVEVVRGNRVEDARGREDNAALRVEVVAAQDAPLPGGYAGTAVRIRSPTVDCPADRLIRIRCQVRTLGFGGAFQGVLVYDSLGGPELGVLVRSPDDWQTVEIYRHTDRSRPVQVMCEISGAGEALLRNVEVNIWDPRPEDPKRLTPISR